jgi:cytochrome c
MKAWYLGAIALAAVAPSFPAFAQDMKGDAGKGKALFEQCSACHSLEAGHNGVGPSLHGLFGRKSAGVEDYVYSPAMRRANVTWSATNLDSFLAEPQAAPFRGNKMPFAGMSDAQGRADLIAYLQQATK